jgi:hypothetical protein
VAAKYVSSSTSTGLTTEEKEEGEAAKKALLEAAGETADGDGSDDEGHKKANQFGQHMQKKTDAVSWHAFDRSNKHCWCSSQKLYNRQMNLISSELCNREAQR